MGNTYDNEIDIYMCEKFYLQIQTYLLSDPTIQRNTLTLYFLFLSAISAGLRCILLSFISFVELQSTYADKGEKAKCDSFA